MCKQICLQIYWWIFLQPFVYYFKREQFSRILRLKNKLFMYMNIICPVIACLFEKIWKSVHYYKNRSNIGLHSSCHLCFQKTFFTLSCLLTNFLPPEPLRKTQVASCLTSHKICSAIIKCMVLLPIWLQLYLNTQVSILRENKKKLPKRRRKKVTFGLWMNLLSKLFIAARITSMSKFSRL